MNNDITVTLKTPGELKSRQGTKSKKSGGEDAAFGQALASASASTADYRDSGVEKAPKQETQGVSETAGSVSSSKDVDSVVAVTPEMLAEKMQTVQTSQFIQSILNGGEASEEGMPEEGLLASAESILTEQGIGDLAEAVQTMDGGMQAMVQMMEASGQGVKVSGQGVNASDVGEEDVLESVHATEQGAVQLGETEELTTTESDAQKTDVLDAARPEMAQAGTAMQTDNQVHKQTAADDGSEKDRTRVTEVKPENHVVDGRVDTAYAQRTTPEQEVASHVTQTGEMREEYADMIKDMIARQISQGKQEIEISLTPKSLGKLIVKVAVEAGETTVSIICTNSKAMQAMSQKAGELGRILEGSLGDKMEVVVDTEKPDSYLQQDGRNASQEQAEQERHAGQEQRKDQEADTADFLQQLRLGLA